MSLLLLDNLTIFPQKVWVDFDFCNVVSVAKELSQFGLVRLDINIALQ